MKLRPLLIILLGLVVADGVAAWRAQARRERTAGSAFVDSALLDPVDLQRASKIVVREKRQSKVVQKEEGFEVRRIVEENEPIREVVLERRPDGWVVASYFALSADLDWVGQTMSDLSQGRLMRYVTSDPELMTDLGFLGTEVRFEDERGVVRKLEFGRKDGGETYQFVRVNGQDAYVAKHEAEILGDPLAWIETRLLRFEAGDVRELELPFADAREAPLVLRRPAPKAPLVPNEALPSTETVSANAEAFLERLLSEQVMMALGRDHTAAEAARHNIAARVRLALFDGRRYEVSWGVLPLGETSLAALSLGPRDVVIAFFQCSDPQDLTQRYGAKAALGYSRGATLGRLPLGREALSHAAAAPVARQAGGTP